MKKTILVALIFYFAAFQTFTILAHPARIFASYFGGSADDELLDVAFGDDGTLVIAGRSTGTNIAVPTTTNKYVFGTDPTSSSSTIFILRLTNDGSTLLSYSRFAYNTVKTNSIRIAVTTDGIYLTGAALSSFASIPGFDGKIDATPGIKPFIARLALDGSKILNATYLGGGDSERDFMDIDVFPNGDLCVNHDNSDSETDFLSRLKPDLSAKVWGRTYNLWCGSARTNALAISPDGNLIYVGGYGMGNTGLEPYKDPFLFCFSGDGQTQYWKRGTATNDYGIFHFPQVSIGANRLISDSQINALATDSLGNALTVGYSDGGATVFTHDPWYGGYYNTEGPYLAESVQDGDSYAGFSGATSVSTLGRLGTDGNWIRSHRVKPYNTWNRWYGVTRAYGNKAYFAGRCSGIPDIDSWEEGGSNGVILRVTMSASGTNRQFVTHPAGVDAMNAIARDRNTYRYAAVGMANANNVLTVNAFQTTYGGAKDGYILIFDDNDKPALIDRILPTQDAYVMYGANVAKNFGADDKLRIKRRDGRPDDTSKSYLKFDLSGITKPITEARLQLYKSGIYDNGQVIVWALKEGFESWSETGITWNNAPANITTSPYQLDKTKADSLGLWNIIKTNQSAVVTFQGSTFTQYINNCRLNGDKAITLVLSSISPVDQNDPALTAASRENATLPKPTLWLATEKPASVVTELKIWPENATITNGKALRFTANVFDQFGSSMQNQSVSFSTSTGANIDNLGNFTSPTSGEYAVTVSSGTLIASTKIKVESALTATRNIINADEQIRFRYLQNTILVNSEIPLSGKCTLYDIAGRVIEIKRIDNKSEIQFHIPKSGCYFVSISGKINITQLLFVK